MDKSIDIPVIPKRPAKTSNTIDVAEGIEDKNKREQPVIPRRPQNSKTNSESSIPIIPARPRVKHNTEFSSGNGSTSDDLSDKFTNELKSTAEISDNLKELENNNEQSDDITENIEERGSSEKLNCESEQDSDLSDTDGEKTPGNTNTKITFKDSVDSLNATTMNPDNNSEFNDDLETVLQEKEEYNGYSTSHPTFDHSLEDNLEPIRRELPLNTSDEVILGLQIMPGAYLGENSTIHNFNEKSEKELDGLSEDMNDYLQNKTNITLNQTGHLDVSDCLEGNRDNKTEQGGLDINSSLVHENDLIGEKTKDTKDKVLSTVDSEKDIPIETDNSNDSNDDYDMNSEVSSNKHLTSEVTEPPIVPRRLDKCAENSIDKRSKEDNVETETLNVPDEELTDRKKSNTESDRILTSLHSVTSNNEDTPIEKDSNTEYDGQGSDSRKKDDGNSETGSNKQSTSEVKDVPIVPNRPRKTEKQDSQDNIKPPPPKPKKLSSKIAAFQQMFNQEQVEKRSEIPKPIINKSPTKLSSDKQKFAESLKGVMGIPLPGMVNPLSKPSDKDIANENTDFQVETNQVSTNIPNNRRAKGPRGKKLPRALKEPINIESELKFSMFTAAIWELKFSKSSKGDLMENLEENMLASRLTAQHPSDNELTNLEYDNNEGTLNLSQESDDNENVKLIEPSTMSETKDGMNMNYDDNIEMSKSNSYIDKSYLKSEDNGEKGLKSQVDSESDLEFEPQHEHALNTVDSTPDSDIPCNNESSEDFA